MALNLGKSDLASWQAHYNGVACGQIWQGFSARESVSSVVGSDQYSRGVTAYSKGVMDEVLRGTLTFPLRQAVSAHDVSGGPSFGLLVVTRVFGESWFLLSSVGVFSDGWCGGVRGVGASPRSAVSTVDHHSHIKGRLGWSHERCETELVLWSLLSREHCVARFYLLELGVVFLFCSAGCRAIVAGPFQAVCDNTLLVALLDYQGGTHALPRGLGFALP